MSVQVLVIGSGAAGLNAAVQLRNLGVEDVRIATEGLQMGTSINTGSDKQTYYKLGLAGDEADSPLALAETLFAGGGMHGDIALAEAALSARAFFHLVELGVPFPCDAFGQYAGYKTDHDPARRATSIGPYTSREMCRALIRKVQALGIPVEERLNAVELLAVGEGGGLRAAGAVFVTEAGEFEARIAENVVFATGGPGGLYAASVYPPVHTGGIGLALRAGAAACNLPESQFGMASVNFRWNVSGTYMQCVPRFVSTAADGVSDPREFLADAIPDAGRLHSLIFLKGYQWPFDARKAAGGSSLLDLLVHRETVDRGRRVFLDFRANPAGFAFAALSDEAREYLEKSGALQETPHARLVTMNPGAAALYREHGTDLATAPLEIAVCAQHNNGGLEVDAWWRSPLSGLYPVGEAAGAHGVYRPGGAALNSGQVGATRAAEWIARRGPQSPPDEQVFAAAAEAVVLPALKLVADAHRRFTAGADDNTGQALFEVGARMSAQAGLVRSAASVADALQQATARLAGYDEAMAIDAGSRRSVDRLFLVRDLVTTQYVYLTAMADYLDHGGRSRGSVLYTDPAGGLPVWQDADANPVDAGLDERFRFVPDDGALDGVAQIVTLRPGPGAKPPDPHHAGSDHVPQPAPAEELPAVECRWRPVRPLPNPDEPFEVVWRGYLADRNVH